MQQRAVQQKAVQQRGLSGDGAGRLQEELSCGRQTRAKPILVEEVTVKVDPRAGDCDFVETIVYSNSPCKKSGNFSCRFNLQA